MFAVCADDHDEWLSVANTRGVNWSLVPPVGGRFVGTRYRTMFTFARDDSPATTTPCSAPAIRSCTDCWAALMIIPVAQPTSGGRRPVSAGTLRSYPDP